MNDRAETIAIKTALGSDGQQRARQLDQVYDRPYARRGRRGGGHRLSAGTARPVSCRRRSATASRTPNATSTISLTMRAEQRLASRCPRRSASAVTTPCWPSRSSERWIVMDLQKIEALVRLFESSALGAMDVSEGDFSLLRSSAPATPPPASGAALGTRAHPRRRADADRKRPRRQIAAGRRVLRRALAGRRPLRTGGRPRKEGRNTLCHRGDEGHERADRRRRRRGGGRAAPRTGRSWNTASPCSA